MNTPRTSRAFTLLEVLIALGIFAVVAAVVLTTSARSVHNAGQLELKTLAGWIADNRITELQLARPSPSEGQETRELQYAGHNWECLSEINSTSDQDLRRITVWVALRELPPSDRPLKERAVFSLDGFVGVRQ